MVTKQQQLEWLAKKYNTWPEQGATYLGLSVAEVGKFAIVNCHLITRREWQQERNKMSSKPEIDNAWHERGELPPVGYECDIRHSCWNSEKYEKVTVAAITNEYVIVKYATFEQHYMLNDISFHPLRTEREKAIEEMANLIAKSVFGSAKCQAEKLYDAGYRKVKP